MGEVFEAEQTEPVRRTVALKVIKWGMDTKQVVARFKAEEQALALMSHPHIARVFDAGATDRGRPYFAMEYVAGVPITQYCDTHRLCTRERLALFLDVCEGVHHAHQKGVIHRDIKPSNVLVTVQDDDPVPKIIDFGVAKATAQKLTEQTVFTEFGQLIGTPEYMSPEQAEMTGLDVDTRTDVYSLGVLLYELLVGVLPFDPEGFRDSGFDEIRRRIRDDDPLKPSTRLTSLGDRSTDLAAKRRTESALLRRQMKGDLDWITMKALEKDRTRRYDSASALAADINRHLHDQPVLAGPPSTTYRMGKFVRRHRAGVAVATMLAILLVGFSVAMVFQSARVARERDRANQEAEAARQVSDFLVSIFEVSDPGETRGSTVTAREILDEGAERINAELSEQPLTQAKLMLTMGNVYTKLGLYDRAASVLEDALAVTENVHGEDHLEVGNSLRNLGIVYDSQGRYEDAARSFERSLAIFEETLGPDDLDVAKALNSLAIVYWNQGRAPEALSLLERSLAIKERALGPAHLDLGTTLSNLGTLHYTEGNFGEAVPHLRRALAIAEQNLDPDHPELAGYLNNLASLLQEQGKYDEAEPLLRRTLVIWESAYGPEHPAVGIVVHNLANLYRDLGDFNLAESYYLRSGEIWGEALGEDHAYFATHLREQAGLYALQGRFAEAEAVFQRSLAIWEEIFGPVHPQVAVTLEKYSVLLREMGRAEEAEQIEARARAMQ
jgi:non-specific serine/threonine protein kinase/serine/threonine-protein kinase